MVDGDAHRLPSQPALVCFGETTYAPSRTFDAEDVHCLANRGRRASGGEEGGWPLAWVGVAAGGRTEVRPARGTAMKGGSAGGFEAVLSRRRDLPAVGARPG